MAKENSLQQLESVLNGLCQKTTDAMSEMKKAILVKEQQIQYYVGLCIQHGIIDKDGKVIETKKPTAAPNRKSRRATKKGKC